VDGLEVQLARIEACLEAMKRSQNQRDATLVRTLSDLRVQYDGVDERLRSLEIRCAKHFGILDSVLVDVTVLKRRGVVWDTLNSIAIAASALIGTLRRQ